MIDNSQSRSISKSFSAAAYSTVADPARTTLPETTSKLQNWVPMPRYLLRCWVVKRFVRAIEPNSFIEIGAASGHIAKWMSDRGMTGTAVEISPDALELMRERLKDSPNIKIFDRDSKHLTQQADMLLSMEVLEHIEDDDAALKNWFDLISPGGSLILSVPAHQNKFSAEDEMVGHFRRYEKAELVDQLHRIGFTDARVYSYGFPLSGLLKWGRTYFAKRKLTSDRRSRQERTEASGVERKRWTGFRLFLNDYCFLPFHLVQMMFLRFDCSDGFIAVAKKPATIDPDQGKGR
jgi:SAM-dependent methyltransferase